MGATENAHTPARRGCGADDDDQPSGAEWADLARHVLIGTLGLGWPSVQRIVGTGHMKAAMRHVISSKADGAALDHRYHGPLGERICIDLLRAAISTSRPALIEHRMAFLVKA
jgi:hypothetical protein